MNERKYEILIDNMPVATVINIEYAMLLVKSLFDHYYNEHSMTVSIREIMEVADDERNTNG